MNHTPQATVLAFNLAASDFARVRSLSAALGIRAKLVPPESFTLPIGAMLGIPVSPQSPPASLASFSDPMLLMCNLDENQFNQFLQFMRGPGMPRVPLKAVLTPHNVGWSAIALHDELSREHEAMARRSKQ